MVDGLENGLAVTEFGGCAIAGEVVLIVDFKIVKLDVLSNEGSTFFPDRYLSLVFSYDQRLFRFLYQV